MICKLEVMPENEPAEAYVVGEVRIGQSGGDCFIASYTVEMDKASRQARSPGVWRTGVVAGFDHSRLGPYDLLLRGLVACLGGRNHRAIAGISPAAALFHEDEPELKSA